MGQKQHRWWVSRNNRAMKKRNTPPPDAVKKTIRFPRSVFEHVEESRKSNERSFNAEVVAKLQADPELDQLRREVAEVKSLLRQVLDLLASK
jgi:hypothetical protein